VRAMRELAVTLVVSALLAGHAQAGDHGSPAEAKAMLAKAIAHCTAVDRRWATTSAASGRTRSNTLRDSTPICSTAFSRT
jgi:hypothetical protein